MTDLPPAREHAMQTAFDFAPADFKNEYRQFILRIASAGVEFTAEDCQLAYKQTSRPQPEEWRSTGNIFRTLMKEGLIKKVGFGWSAERGVPVPKYARA